MLLLDTHVLLWWLADSRRLRASWRAAIGDPATRVLVSAVSVWEMAITLTAGASESFHTKATLGSDIDESREERPEPPKTWKERPTIAAMRVGIAAPLGNLGLSVDHSFHPSFALSTGVGVGLGWEGFAPNVAGGLHLRPAALTRNAWVLDILYSGGSYRQVDSVFSAIGHDERPEMGTPWAHWLQLGTGWERQGSSGIVLRALGGVAVMLNPGDMICRPGYDPELNPCSSGVSSEVLIYQEFTVDYAF